MSKTTLERILIGATLDMVKSLDPKSTEHRMLMIGFMLGKFTATRKFGMEICRNTVRLLDDHDSSKAKALKSYLDVSDVVVNTIREIDLTDIPRLTDEIEAFSKQVNKLQSKF